MKKGKKWKNDTQKQELIGLWKISMIKGESRLDVRIYTYNV